MRRERTSGAVRRFVGPPVRRSSLGGIGRPVAPVVRGNRMRATPPAARRRVAAKLARRKPSAQARGAAVTAKPKTPKKPIRRSRRR